MLKRYFLRMRGAARKAARKSPAEIIWSWLGAFAGIWLVWVFNEFLGLPGTANLYLIGSFGASAVLLYGAPAAELSQPRNLIGGHAISAIVGVACALLCPPNVALASALAVSTAIAAMHLTQTLHPPGGATALIAVIGGDSVRELGFTYALSPVLSGAVVMLLVALLVNNLSSNEPRHYPKHWF
ncbi:MAG: HPP family protein [Azoarcus sp.]|jgi:CBS domain-containing membrane protein|nr:HPP family protein [Azoarcus sp.]